jgi:hypothetical protein
MHSAAQNTGQDEGSGDQLDVPADLVAQLLWMQTDQNAEPNDRHRTRHNPILATVSGLPAGMTGHKR